MKPGEAIIRSKSRTESRREAPPEAPGSAPVGDGASARRAEVEDRELVRRAQTGDEVAFRQLVERHGSRVHALALRILRSASDAEEVAQDALVRAWRALPRFRGDSAFSSWLYRIVVRQAFDRAAILKGRRMREAGLETVDEGPRVATPGPDDDARQRTVRLERLVAGLPVMPRTVVTLYYYQDRSVEEVAKILDMPENTVKTHLSRARATLRSAWMCDEDTAPRPTAGRREGEPR